MRILIVDDETISRRILEEKLKPFGPCTTAGESIKAVQLFDDALKEKKPFDLITLDVSMPRMDGRQLLNLIRKKERRHEIKKENQAKVIMVTARMNTSTIKACIKAGCNGYLTKPVNKIQLIENLGRLGFDLSSDSKSSEGKARDLMVAEIIKRFYEGQIQLPILPRIVQHVQKIRSDENATIESLAQVMETDIALGARLISAANSALYKGVDEAVTLNDALVRLGMKTSCDLVTAIVARDLFESKNTNVKKMLEKLWRHSFACGSLARELSLEMGMEKGESLFLMGIVHDIGKMFLIKALLDIFPEEDFVSDQIQYAIHEIHTTFGSVLLKRLKFPAKFRDIAQFHHWNNFGQDDDRALLIIHLADYLTGQIGYHFIKMEADEGKDFEKLETLESFKQLGLDREKTIQISGTVKEIISDSLDSF